MSTSLPSQSADERIVELKRELAAARASVTDYAQRTNQLQALMRLLGATMSVADAAHIVVNQGRTLCGAAATVIFLKRGDKLELIALGDGDTTQAPAYAEVALDARQPASDVVRSGQPVWIATRDELHQHYPEVADIILHGRSLSSIVALPLEEAGVTLGCLTFGFYEPLEPDDALRDFLRMVAEQSSQALRRARLFAAEREARMATQRRQERALVVAQAAGALASIRDSRAALIEFARIVVPELGDWCAIDELGPDGTPRRLAVYHRDPEMLAIAEAFDRDYPPDPNAPHSVANVIRTGVRQCLDNITDEMFVAGARDATHLALLRKLRLRSFAVLPMVARGRVLGALTLVTEGARNLDADDLAAAEELGRHAALALENARLFEAAERERARMTALVATTTAIVWSARADGTVTEVSPSWVTFTGQPPSEFLGHGFLDYVHPDDRANAEACWRAATTARTLYEVEYRLRRADGTYAHTVARGTPIFDGDELVEYIGCNVDITSLRMGEHAAREHAEDLTALNEIGRMISAELDHNKVVQAVNDAATALTHAQFGAFFYNVTDERGASYMLHAISGIPRERFAHLAMPRDTDVFGPTFRGEGVIRVADITHDRRYGNNPPYHGMPAGHPPVRSYLAAPVVSRSGEVLGGLFLGHPEVGRFDERAETLVVGLAAQAAVAIDNARMYGEAKHLIRALQQSNRDLDQFAYVTSHDLKAPLRGITSLSEWLEEDLADSLEGESRKNFELLRGRVRRMEGLINGILDYSRIGRGTAKRQTVKLQRLLEETIELIAPPGPARIEIDAGMPVLHTDRAMLQQVFINLIGNALKHGARSDLIVQISHRDRGDFWEFAVQDNGPGIPKAYQARLWGIFQILHERDKLESTGIGLAIVKKIVETRGGSVHIESDGKSGTTFLFTWPKIDPSDRDAYRL